MKMRVGIAGYGIVGSRRHEYLKKNPRFDVICVCDRKFQSEGKLDDGISYYSNYVRMLDKESIDVLFVCLTNDVAPEATILGLRNGCHVFCEKPPGRNVQDILDVINVSKNHPKQKLKYGFNHRYHDSIMKALDIVNKGELGSVINLRGVYGKSKILDLRSDWRTQRSIAGGGILLDQGIHMVDLFRLFAGDFQEVHSFVSNRYWNHDVEDNAYAIMKNQDGVVGMLNSSATQWRHRFNLEISLSRGAIILSGILSGTKSYGAEIITIVEKNEDDMGDPLETSIRYNKDLSWKREIDEFQNSIDFDEPVFNGSASEALKTMQLVYQIYCADPVWKKHYGLTIFGDENSSNYQDIHNEQPNQIL